MRRRRRWLWLVASLPLAGWMTSLAAVVVAARADDAGTADAIVVLGAAQYDGKPSPVLRARLQHAAELWRRGLAPVVIVTGGVGTRDTISEAAVGAAYLRAAGLPDSVVLVEGTGRSSEPSLRAAAARVRARGGRRVVLVSDGFHMLRLAIIARRLHLDAAGSPAPGSPIRRNRRREAGYLLAESFKAPLAFFVARSE